MGRLYVLDGACVLCSLGTSPGKIKVTAQHILYIQGKLKVTDADKLIEPNFSSCKRSSNQPACTPKLKKWQLTSRKVTMGEKKFVMNDSTIECTYGGLIKIQDPLQRTQGAGSNSKIMEQLSDTVPFVPHSQSASKWQ
jgi:hypothetical protein